MQRNTSNSAKTVVVHRSARDAYEVSAALAEAGLLEALITDLYWPYDSAWAARLLKFLPYSVQQLLRARTNPKLPSKLVSQALLAGIVSMAVEKMPFLPFGAERKATRWTDAVLGKRAGQRAADTRSLLLSYSYYGYHAFSEYGRPGMLFQLHPHPLSIRRILEKERANHPECASSLDKEWELSLPEEDFQRLVTEVTMASHWMVASSFTRSTLVENGVSENAVDVIPYGVDLQKFGPRLEDAERSSHKPLRLLFVGRINQRKGIKYLLEAFKLLKHRKVQLTICGRIVDDMALLAPFSSQIMLRPSVSASELVRAYQEADLFVLPSVAEGFGQVLLEALACGLPILSTTRTAAPDLIDEGIQGFVVEPCRPDLLAGRIEWALQHRTQLREMREAARRRAEQFTWNRFRKSVVESVLRFHALQSGHADEVAQHV